MPDAADHRRDRTQAAQGPSPQPVSAAENPAPAARPGSSAEANGRRILSTAFVREDAHRHLTVELHDGRVLVLRDVVMRKKDFCGLDVGNGTPPAHYCGRYAEVAAARPGGAPVVAEPVSAASNPVPRDR